MNVAEIRKATCPVLFTRYVIEAAQLTKEVNTAAHLIECALADICALRAATIVVGRLAPAFKLAD